MKGNGQIGRGRGGRGGKERRRKGERRRKILGGREGEKQRAEVRTVNRKRSSGDATKKNHKEVSHANYDLN